MKIINYRFEECDTKCDNCETTATVYGTNYTDINAELKESGWVIRKVDGDWCDFCSNECYQEYKKRT